MAKLKFKILMPDELENKVCVIVGTRPGIIKFSPIIRELVSRDIPFFLIHTGQHYSYEMDKKFFEELNLPEPAYKLKGIRRCRLHGEQTGRMLIGIEKALIIEKPKIVLVGGDANTNLAGALAARKLHIYVGHVEAGLRSYDWRMPEEHNRVMIDHISDYLFAPTELAKQNLIRDNVRGKIYVVGNTIVDAVKQNLQIAKTKSEILRKLVLKPRKYFVLTVHREENVDFPENLKKIIKILYLITKHFGYPIIFPIHPRTRKRIKSLGLKMPRSVIVTKPLGYLDFLSLLYNCLLVLTDSGGIQEEACIVKVPCVTLRESTERPETVSVGSNIVTGLVPENVLNAIDIMISSKREWKNPFGENVSKKIINIIEREVLK